MITTLSSTDNISHLIQLAVAPVFLLASVGALLGVFTNRLTRIIDKFEKTNTRLLNYESQNKEDDVKKLQLHCLLLLARAHNMNITIFFTTSTGFLVAFSIVTIFMSSFFTFDGSVFITVFFITAMFSLMIALSLFLKEIILATKFLKRDLVA